MKYQSTAVTRAKVCLNFCPTPSEAQSRFPRSNIGFGESTIRDRSTDQRINRERRSPLIENHARYDVTDLGDRVCNTSVSIVVSNSCGVKLEDMYLLHEGELPIDDRSGGRTEETLLQFGECGDGSLLSLGRPRVILM